MDTSAWASTTTHVVNAYVVFKIRVSTTASRMRANTRFGIVGKDCMQFGKIV